MAKADDTDISESEMIAILNSKNAYLVRAQKSDLAKNLILWVIIALTLLTVFKNFDAVPERIESSKIKANISKSISNGAEIEVIRRIYENRSPYEVPFIEKVKGIFEDKPKTYPYDTPLSSILHDIRADLFLSDVKPKEALVKEIDKIILEHEQQNPFDKLGKQQKDYFENIRQKSGDSYSFIQNDINKLSDELYSKNILVEQYLSDSKTSLYISIFSFAFALIYSIFQFFQSRPQKIAANIMSAIADINSSKEQKEN